MGYPGPLMTTNHFDGPFLAIPVWAIEVIKDRGHPRDLQVLTGIVGCMDLRTRTTVATHDQIAEYIGVSRETVKRSLRWLGSEGIILVSRSGNSVNRYTVQYRPRRGVTGDLPGGHGRPPETPEQTRQGESRGVTGDPPKMDVSPGQTGNPQNTDIYSNRELVIRNGEAPCGGGKDEMILGQDPDDVREKPAEKTPTPTKAKKPRGAYELADHFMFHPKSLMSQSYTPQDRRILMATFKRLLDGGLTRPSVVRMINNFWEHPTFSRYSSPVEAFSSKAVQKSLLETTEVVVLDDNPVLTMMANDFTRGDVDLPWHSSADGDLGKAVMLRCMDACYRYPEIVADIATAWNGEFTHPEFLATLDALNDLVRWHCAQQSVDHEDVIKKLSSFNLPQPLLNTSPTMLRSPAGTIEEAVYNYRRFGNG
jgi:hypothetical protein